MKFLFVSLLIHLSLFLLFSIKKTPPEFSLNFKKGIAPLDVESVPSPKTMGEGKKATEKTESIPSVPEGITNGSEYGVTTPEYPSLSKLRGEEGKVLLSLTLNEKNELVAVEVLQTSGFPLLDRAALNAVKVSLKKASESREPRKKKVEFNFTLKSTK